MLQKYHVHIKGIRPIIMHNGAAGLDIPVTCQCRKGRTYSKKKGSNRTSTDDERLQELECQVSLWLDASGAPTIPSAAIRSCIETGARKLKQGPQVREGLIVDAIEAFTYDKSLGTTVEELGKSAAVCHQCGCAAGAYPTDAGRVRRVGACCSLLETDSELIDQDTAFGMA